MRRVEFTWAGGRVSYLNVTDEECAAISNAFNAGNNFSMYIDNSKNNGPSYTMLFNASQLVSVRIEDA